jgi:CubicO group peptidase (beta-lactamase class C family)
MKPVLLFAVAGGLLCGACTGDAAGPNPVTLIDVARPWTRATPAAMQMVAQLTARAVSAAASVSRVRALLVARHGRLVVEQYFGGADSTTRFDVRSVTKSIVSALTGLALARGLLPSLTATVGAYIGAPDTLDRSDSAVTLAQLLTMTSGYQWNETTGNDYSLWVTSPNRVQFLLDRAQTGPPGPFVYNSAAVHLLGVLVQRATGVSLSAFADSALFAPAGITSAVWEPLDSGTVNGGSGIALTGRDLLRYAQLVLQGGRSGERQIIPADWVRTITAPHFPWRTTVGPQGNVTYGYLWWVTDGPPVHAFFAWGYGGQFIYIAPDLDLVAVVTTEWVGLGPAAPAVTDSALAVIVNGVIPAAR